MLTITLGVFVSSFILAWAYFRIKWRRMMELAEKMPGPKPLPIIGNILEFGNNTKEMFDNMNRLSQAYENESLFRYWLGPQLCVNLIDPACVEAVLSNAKVLDKAWSYKYVEPWLGTGILTGTGQKWRTHRRLINPTFHVRILEQFVDVFNSNAGILIQQLSSHVNGPEFDIYSYITMCALDNICDTAMGVSVNAQKESDSEYVRAIKSMCDSIMVRSFKPWLHPAFLFNMSSLGRLQSRCLRVLHGMTKNVIKSRKQELLQTATFDDDNEVEHIGTRKRMAFLDLLIQSSQAGTVLKDEDIREEVDTLMFAGHDTTASAMNSTCWALATYQNIQENVLLELNGIFGDSDRPPTFQDLQEMKYLEQVIKESLRLYPSVPLYGRQLTEELVVGEYILPAHTNVFISPYVIHRNPKYFPDPERFDPDRFLPDNVLNRHTYCYIPFAAGPRNCVGQKYAILEMKATVCQLLRKYKLLPGTTPLNITNEIVLKSLTGIHVKLGLRQEI